MGNLCPGDTTKPIANKHDLELQDDIKVLLLGTTLFKHANN
jgi:hypothetical protein